MPGENISPRTIPANLLQHHRICLGDTVIVKKEYLNKSAIMFSVVSLHDFTSKQNEVFHLFP